MNWRPSPRCRRSACRTIDTSIQMRTPKRENASVTTTGVGSVTRSSAKGHTRASDVGRRMCHPTIATACKTRSRSKFGPSEPTQPEAAPRDVLEICYLPFSSWLRHRMSPLVVYFRLRQTLAMRLGCLKWFIAMRFLFSSLF